MTSTTSNNARVTTRLPISVKETLQKAVDLTRTTLNQFIIQAAVEEAQEVINTEHRKYFVSRSNKMGFGYC